MKSFGQFVFLCNYYIWRVELSSSPDGWPLVIGRIVQHIFIGLFIGLSTVPHTSSASIIQSRVSVINSSRLVSTFLPIAFQPQIVKDQRTAAKVGLNRIVFGPAALFLSRFVTFLLWRFVFLSSFAGMVYSIAPMRSGIVHFLEFFGILAAHHFGKTATGFLIVTLVRHRAVRRVVGCADYSLV
jgi:hypothetical protein